MFDLDELGATIEARARVARIVLTEVKGSAPRSVGTSMLVWSDGSSGTIGGGQLELQAMQTAREMLAQMDGPRIVRQALGPELNQCCGGAVEMVIECFDTARYRSAGASFTHHGIFARPVSDQAGTVPEKLLRMMDRFEHSDSPMPLTLFAGWLAESVWRNTKPVYIYGAGHVGRALAQVLAPMPSVQVLLADVRPEQFDGLPDHIRQSWHVPPHEHISTAPDDTAHLIMTPDHDYDLELCHQLLTHGKFGFAGLIGSSTKWARFRRRLLALGHTDVEISRMTCPIGDPSLGKHPQAIAVGVAARLLNCGALHTVRGDTSQ